MQTADFQSFRMFVATRVVGLMQVIDEVLDEADAREGLLVATPEVLPVGRMQIFDDIEAAGQQPRPDPLKR